MSHYVFNHCETTRRDVIMNEPILESRIIILNFKCENFFTSNYKPCPDPHKAQFLKMFADFCLKFQVLWALGAIFKSVKFLMLLHGKFTVIWTALYVGSVLFQTGSPTIYQRDQHIYVFLAAGCLNFYPRESISQ